MYRWISHLWWGLSPISLLPSIEERVSHLWWGQSCISLFPSIKIPKHEESVTCDEVSHTYLFFRQLKFLNMKSQSPVMKSITYLSFCWLKFLNMKRESVTCDEVSHSYLFLSIEIPKYDERVSHLYEKVSHPSLFFRRLKFLNMKKRLVTSITFHYP